MNIEINVNHFKRFENKATRGFFTLELSITEYDKDGAEVVNKLGIMNCTLYQGKNNLQWAFKSTKSDKDGNYYNDAYITKDLYNLVLPKAIKAYEDSKSETNMLA